jgi:hypothetical protein
VKETSNFGPMSANDDDASNEGTILFQDKIGNAQFKFVAYPSNLTKPFLFIPNISELNERTKKILTGLNFSEENPIQEMSDIIDIIVKHFSSSPSPISADKYNIFSCPVLQTHS